MAYTHCYVLMFFLLALSNQTQCQVVLDKLLKKIKQRGEKVVIFSQFTMMLDLLEDYLVLRSYSFLRLDGSTSLARRRYNMMLFERQVSPSMPVETVPWVFLVSTRAGGLGLNLQAANNLVLFDADWNPQMDRQAMVSGVHIG